MRVHRRRRLLFAAVAALLAMRIFAVDARADVVLGPARSDPGTTTEPAAIADPSPPAWHGRTMFALGALAGALVAIAILEGAASLRRRRKADPDNHSQPEGATAENGLPKTRRALLRQIAPFVLFGVGVVLLAGTVVAWWSVQAEGGAGEVDVGSGAAPPQPNDASSARPVVPPKMADPNVLEKALDVPDPHHIELLDVVQQATTLALQLEPSAELTSIQAGDLRGGLLDSRSTRNPLAWISFDFKRSDAKRPPGEDVTRGSVGVSLANGMLRARRDGSSDGLSRLIGPPQAPRCSLRDAWAAVRESGVPENAVAGVALSRTPVKRAPVWSFGVDGHEEFRREVDASSCALVNGKENESPAPKSASKPRPRIVFDCGCHPGDLLCTMKCNGRK